MYMNKIGKLTAVLLFAVMLVLGWSLIFTGVKYLDVRRETAEIIEDMGENEDIDLTQTVEETESLKQEMKEDPEYAEYEQAQKDITWFYEDIERMEQAIKRWTQVQGQGFSYLMNVTDEEKEAIENNSDVKLIKELLLNIDNTKEIDIDVVNIGNIMAIYPEGQYADILQAQAFNKTGNMNINIEEDMDYHMDSLSELLTGLALTLYETTGIEMEFILFNKDATEIYLHTNHKGEQQRSI